MNDAQQWNGGQQGSGTGLGHQAYGGGPAPQGYANGPSPAAQAWPDQGHAERQWPRHGGHLTGPTSVGHGQPPSWSQQAPAAPSQKQRRWPWIVGIVAAFLVGLMIPTGATTSVPASAYGPSPLQGGTFTPAFSAPFTLEVSSKLGREVQVNYDTGAGGMNSETGVSTWSKQIPTATQYGSGQVSVSSHAPFTTSGSDEREDTVTCRIADANGKVVQEQTGKGQYASASCIGY